MKQIGRLLTLKEEASAASLAPQFRSAERLEEPQILLRGRHRRDTKRPIGLRSSADDHATRSRPSPGHPLPDHRRAQAGLDACCRQAAFRGEAGLS